MSHLEPQPESTTIVSSQSAFPTRATARTFVQAWLPQVLTALVVIPAVVQIVLDEVERNGIVLPPWLGLLLAGVLTVCAAVSAVLARIMAIPAVDAWLRRIRLSSTPKA